VVYFSWLTMEEMAEVCYLALGLAWLGLWLKAGGGRSAGWTGAMLGAACAVKYLSVGFVAGPVLAVMLVVSLRRPRRVRQLVLAAAVTLAVFAPWLVRNLVSTGNPVFPLATDIFGAGYWDGESARRWRSGHAGGFHPPVPVPPDYQPQPPGPSRAGLMAAFFLREFRPGGAGEGDPYLGQPSLGLLTLPLLAGAILAMLIRPRRFGAWEWGLLAVTGMQLTAWAAFTHDMPARFIAVAVAPMSLLISGALSRLSGVRQPPLWRQSPGAGGRWGLAPAGLLVVAAVGMNLASAGLYYRTEMARYRFLGGAFGALVGLPAADAARMYRASDLAWGLPASSRLLLVGDSAAFYYPDGTAYATVFGEHPLQGMLSRAGSPAEVAGGLRRAGLTHVLVDWREIDRLRYSYGWPAVLDPDRLEGLLAGWPILKRYPPAMATSAPGPAGRPFLTLYAVPSAPPAATAPGR
jgi:hypothetical protein